MSGTLFGFGVDTALRLTRLGPAPAARGRIRVETGALAELRGVTVHQHELGGVRFQVDRLADGRLLARCGATGTFLVDAAGATITAEPRAETDEAWEHRLASVAVPLLLAELGDAVLHASALAVDGDAVVFAGPAGRGKSTLALAGVDLGHRLLAEDGAAVTFVAGRPVVWPGPQGVRLRSGAAKAVRAVSADALAREPARLAAIVFLDERGAEAVPARRVARAEAVPLLTPLLIYSGKDGLRAAFENAARLSASAPSFRASLPDDLDLLSPTLARLVGDVLESSA